MGDKAVFRDVQSPRREPAFNRALRHLADKLLPQFFPHQCHQVRCRSDDQMMCQHIRTEQLASILIHLAPAAAQAAIRPAVTQIQWAVIRTFTVGHVLQQFLQPLVAAFRWLLILPVRDNDWLAHRRFCTCFPLISDTKPRSCPRQRSHLSCCLQRLLQ